MMNSNAFDSFSGFDEDDDLLNMIGEDEKSDDSLELSDAGEEDSVAEDANFGIDFGLDDSEENEEDVVDSADLSSFLSSFGNDTAIGDEQLAIDFGDNDSEFNTKRFEEDSSDMEDDNGVSAEELGFASMDDINRPDDSEIGEVDMSELRGGSKNNSDFDIDDMYVNREDAVGLSRIHIDKDAFEFKHIDVKKITVTATRIRKNYSLDKLIMSIKNEGLLNPIVVAPTKTEGIYVVVKGLRRLLACASVGLKEIPCIVNNKVMATEIPIVEALYSHSKSYTIQEMLDYINYLKTEKGIASSTYIEHLLNMESGDYNKLMDIIEDDDEEIVTQLLGGQLSIQQAFKKLEQKRKKMSKDEKDTARAGKVYGNVEEYGADKVQNSGETSDGSIGLTDAELSEITAGATDFDDVDNKSLQSLVDDSNNMEGYGFDKQTAGAREGIDPAIRKAVITRDGGKCVICGFGGPGLESCIDIHHIVGVAQGQDDNPEDCVCLCITDHMAVECWAYGKLPVTGIEEMTEAEQKRMKRIIKLGNVKRDAMIRLGKKREQIKNEGAEATKLRRMPGAAQPRA